MVGYSGQTKQTTTTTTTTTWLLPIRTMTRPVMYLSAISVVLVILLTLTPGDEFKNNNKNNNKVVSVAMIGNSLQYYNDLPRLLEAMADGTLIQDSSLHGKADLESHLYYGNGMYGKWQTGEASIEVEEEEQQQNQQEQDPDYELPEDVELFDYGACTIPQLLFGFDNRLIEKYGGEQRQRRRQLDNANDADADADDDADADKNVDDNNNNNNDDKVDDDNNVKNDDDDDDDNSNVEDSFELKNDGTNPCLQNENYYWYRQRRYELFGSPKWDYILLNDNTRNPCCTTQREVGLEVLKLKYIPWFQQTGATPIFLSTYAYWAANRDMSGLVDIPTFASLTYSGYLEYVDYVATFLPESQKPRIAPVGNAMLMVWEESPNIWEDLMHYDGLHLSPSGTFLEACVVYATIFGKLPSARIVFNEDKGMSSLWDNARRMAPAEDGSKPYPTQSLAKYLYYIADRVAIHGEVPKSLLLYENYTSVYFIPDDSSVQ